MRYLVFFIFVFFVVSNVNAQQVFISPVIITNSIPFDNDVVLDLFGLKRLNFDRDYTMGVGFGHGRTNIKHNKALYQPLRFINRFFCKKYFDNDSLYHNWQVINGSFTPDTISLAKVLTNDRPYASITGIQTMVSKHSSDLKIQKISKLFLGFLGTPIAKWTQTFIHSNFKIVTRRSLIIPKGWDNQISNFGEPTLLYTFESNRFLTNDRQKHPRTQNKVGYKYSIGYNTTLSLKLEGRIGKIDPHTWFSFNNPLESVQTYTVSTESNLSKNKGGSSLDGKELKMPSRYFHWEWYIFYSLEPQFVFYNALLRGQFEGNKYQLDASQTKSVVVHFIGGGGLTIPCHKGTKAINVKFRIGALTPEFQIQDVKTRWHYWGGIDLNWWKIIVPHRN